jgi:hypothetical protein
MVMHDRADSRSPNLPNCPILGAEALLPSPRKYSSRNRTESRRAQQALGQVQTAGAVGQAVCASVDPPGDLEHIILVR